MSVLNNSALIGLLGAAPSSGGGYAIERSVRFNSSDSAYLSRTPASAGNRKTWTWAGWVKKTALNGSYPIFSAGVTATSYLLCRFRSGDTFGFDQFGTATNFFVQTTAVFRDASAWYHVVFAFDTTQSTESNRIKLYINGVQQTLTTGTNWPAQNADLLINNNIAHSVGSDISNQGGGYLNGYLADIHFIDGQALDPTSFGEFDDNGIWQPIAYSGTYGTNGFHLPFSDNSTAAVLGTDTSGNGNTWTVNNISVAAGAGNDSLVDVPTNGTETDTGLGGEVRGNYATLNPLFSDFFSSAPTYSNGNLDLTQSSDRTTFGTIAVSSGKWYWEITIASGTNQLFGITDTSKVGIGTGTYNQAGSYYYYPAVPRKYVNGSFSSYGSTVSVGDVVGVALDLDAGEITFYKNNVSQGVMASSLPAATYVPGFGAGNTTACAQNINFGQRPFAYTAPSGFKTLCTANLPAPVVTKPSEVMDVALYTGNGGTQTISGLGFSPDLVWIKGRSIAADHGLFDIVRGTTKRLVSNATQAEDTQSGITAFNSNGFDLGSYAGQNNNNDTYVAWTWDAGSSTVTNTSGSITSTVRANASAGFSIVSYTGTGSNATVGHGLGVAPKLIICKTRSSSVNWIVYHGSLGTYDFLRLNTTDAVDNNSVVWNTAPTSTVFGVGTANGVNQNGDNYVAYCFAPVAGYSSFGSFVTNGANDNAFVYTGFRPRWVLWKRTDGANSWGIVDTARNAYNVVGNYLLANASDAEANTTLCDILSNGFKMRTSGFGNGETYIYAAFAESPFQYARAR